LRYSHIEVSSPQSLSRALELLAQDGEELRIISGGTDVAVCLKDGTLEESRLLNLSRLEGLDYIREENGCLAIGARATFSWLVHSRIVRRWAPLLSDASVEVGSLQIRNLATLAGNVCNASPAADSLPPLYVHNAIVVLASVMGKRELPIDKFVLGPRKTARRSSELLTEVRVPKMAFGSHHFFKKLGLRSSQAISVVSVAASWKRRKARIALGAVAPTVVRAWDAEDFIFKRGLGLDSIDEVCVLVSKAASPIDDLRGSRGYRLEAIRALAYEGFYEQLAGEEIDAREA
jgi:CO/xanthine dehydrogenase FAD-binding subunit